MLRTPREKIGRRSFNFGPVPVAIPGLPWQQRFVVNTPWLIRLRWVAVIGQLITIGSVWMILDIELPLLSLFSVLTLTSISNLAFGGWFVARGRMNPQHDSEFQESTILTAVMALDLILLTALLYFTGGPTNPFAVFFFVNLSLCAFVLHRAAAWGLKLLAIL